MSCCSEDRATHRGFGTDPEETTSNTDVDSAKVTEGGSAITEVTEMQTKDGPLSVKLFIPEGGAASSSFLALGGLGRSPSWLDWEGSGIAAHLASRPKPYRVLLPDPYSNPQTAPSASEFAVVLSVTTLFGCFPGDCRESYLLDLMPKPEKGQPVVLAGHSWGGGAAARLAAAHPEKVSRLVLISPDVQESVAQRTFSIPTLLIWARDDGINPYLWTCRWRGHPKLTIHTTEKGGHMVQASHAAIISRWLAEQDALDEAAQELM